ncbi:MAG TPA: hypothetical protein VFP37_03180, partial [Steroidobacteraceae bacterium]|nr:hypothetical protein [Steroidobacteraceae bacterium]
MKLQAKEAAVRLFGAAMWATLLCCPAAMSGTRAEHAAAEAARSYIVEARSTDAAAAAVTAAGGEVVSRLDIIDAVEANLTDA